MKKKKSMMIQSPRLFYRLPFFILKVLLCIDQDLSLQCNAVLALVHLVELIQLTAKTDVPPKRLLAAAEKFLQQFKEAWGVEWMTPKFHWLLHLHRTLELLGFLLNCFCLERKHRVPKRYAGEITNISSGSSLSLLKEVTCHHLGQLNQPDAFSFEIGLVHGRKASRRVKKLLADELELSTEGAESLMYSKESRFSPLATCCKDDVVLFKDGLGFRAGRVHLHFSVHGLPITMVSAFAVHRLDDKCGHSVWTCSEESMFIETDQILDTVVYSALPNGKVAILLPLEFR